MRFSRRSKTSSARQSTRRGCRPRCEILEGRALLATFNVTNVAGLRAAVLAVNAKPTQPATIVLKPGTYDLTDQLQIVGASNLTIKAKGPGPVIDTRRFQRGKTVRYRRRRRHPRRSDDHGWSRRVRTGRRHPRRVGQPQIDHCTISGNSAGFGGGIFAEGGGTLTVEHSTISGNATLGQGGGISAFGAGAAGILTVEDSTISGNTVIGWLWWRHRRRLLLRDRRGQHDLRKLGELRRRRLCRNIDPDRHQQHDLRKLGRALAAESTPPTNPI